MKKTILLLIGLASACAHAAEGAAPASATKKTAAEKAVSTPKAEKLSEVDRLKLENLQKDMLLLQYEFAELKRQIEQELPKRAEQLQSDAKKLLSPYRIDPAELGKSVTIKPDGTIERAAQVKADKK